MSRYRVEHLGVLPKTDVVVGTSLNNHGQVVGYAYKHVPPGHGNSLFAHAFLWEKGKLRPLVTPQGEFAHASEINDSGDIAGDADTPGAWFPVRWNVRKTSPVVLAPDAGGAVAINPRGDTLLETTAVRRPDGKWEPTERWWLHSGGVRTAVPSPDGRRFRLTGLNGQGAVIGYSHTEGALGGDGSSPRGFVRRDGTVHWLSGATDGWSTPQDIDERGAVVGWFQPKNGHRQACRWDGARRTDLGTLGGTSSEALAINQRGVIAGWATDAEEGRSACLWVGGKPRDLQKLISRKGGYRLTEAVDVNDRGQLLAHGIDRHGFHASFLLTPD